MISVKPNFNSETADSSVDESKEIHASFDLNDNSFASIIRRSLSLNASPKRFDDTQDTFKNSQSNAQENAKKDMLRGVLGEDWEDFECIEIKGNYYAINPKDINLCSGFLMFPMVSRKRRVSFLRFKDKQQASRMYDYLISSDHEYVVKCYEIFPHLDKEWLVAVEPIESIEFFFMRMKKDWESKCNQRSIAASKASWCYYMNGYFIDISQKVKRALCTLIEDEKFINQGTIYTNNPEKCLVISIADNRVKFLPNGETNKSKGIDIEKMQQFLSHFIGLPFGLNDVAADSDFKLPNELLSFLHNLCSNNLKFVGPKFLLGAPLGWREIEGYRFIINLDDLLKRHVIKKKFLDEKLQCDHEAAKWSSNLAKYPVLFAIFNFPGFSNGTTANYVLAVDVVRYCSNVYRHYNDDNYKWVRTKFLERGEIEKELRAAIPDLYVNLYDALLLYAKSNPRKREAIFDKLLSSEDL